MRASQLHWQNLLGAYCIKFPPKGLWRFSLTKVAHFLRSRKWSVEVMRESWKVRFTVFLYLLFILMKLNCFLGNFCNWCNSRQRRRFFIDSNILICTLYSNIVYLWQARGDVGVSEFVTCYDYDGLPLIFFKIPFSVMLSVHV